MSQSQHISPLYQLEAAGLEPENEPPSPKPHGAVALSVVLLFGFVCFGYGVQALFALFAKVFAP